MITGIFTLFYFVYILYILREEVIWQALLYNSILIYSFSY